LTEPFPTFALNTHKLDILKHYINIVFILQKNHINRLYFELNNKITNVYNYPLITPFDIFCQQEVNWISSSLGFQ
jgi:hypothetical protein